MSVIPIIVFVAFAMGIGSYHFARKTIEARRVSAGGVPDVDIFENSVEDNYHFRGYMISALVMMISTVLTIRLVTPMGNSDYYAILLDAAILLFIAMGITLTWIDLELKILPTKIIYTGGLGTLALLIAAAIYRGGWELLIPMAVGGAFYFAFYGLIWFWIPGSIGFGDVRLSFFIGATLAFLSPQAAFVGIAAPWLLATLGILASLPFGTINSKLQIAFGPWMILGAFVALFWGRLIVSMIIK